MKSFFCIDKKLRKIWKKAVSFIIIDVINQLAGYVCPTLLTNAVLTMVLLLMKMPERSRTSSVRDLLVLSRHNSLCDVTWCHMTAGRHTVVIGQTVQPSECSHTHRQKDSSDSITSTADAGGNELMRDSILIYIFLHCQLCVLMYSKSLSPMLITNSFLIHNYSGHYPINYLIHLNHVTPSILISNLFKLCQALCHIYLKHTGQSSY